MRGGVTGVVVCNAPEAIGLPGFSVMEPRRNVRRRTILTSLVDTVVSSGNLSTHSSSMEGGCFGLGCVLESVRFGSVGFDRVRFGWVHFSLVR